MPESTQDQAELMLNAQKQIGYYSSELYQLIRTMKVSLEPEWRRLVIKDCKVYVQAMLETITDLESKIL